MSSMFFITTPFQGALNRQGDITPMGHCLAMMPLEPRLSQTILMACLFRCGDPMITMAAASCFREPWIQQDTRLGLFLGCIILFFI